MVDLMPHGAYTLAFDMLIALLVDADVSASRERKKYFAKCEKACGRDDVPEEIETQILWNVDVPKLDVAIADAVDEVIDFHAA